MIHNHFYSAKIVPPCASGKGQALRVCGKQFSFNDFLREKILFVKTLTVALLLLVMPKKIIMAHKNFSLQSIAHTCCLCNRELTHSEIAAQQDMNVDFNDYCCDGCTFESIHEYYLPDEFEYSDAGQLQFTYKKQAA